MSDIRLRKALREALEMYADNISKIASSRETPVRKLEMYNAILPSLSIIEGVATNRRQLQQSPKIISLTNSLKILIKQQQSRMRGQQVAKRLSQQPKGPKGFIIVPFNIFNTLISGLTGPRQQRQQQFQMIDRPQSQQRQQSTI